MFKKMTMMVFSATLVIGLAACGSANKQGAGTIQGIAPGQTTPPAATVDAAAGL